MNVTKDSTQNEAKGIGRRGFIGSVSALLGGGLMGFAQSSKQEQPTTQPSDSNSPKKIVSYRTLGRTGFKVSDISLGGVELTTPALVRAALDAGINYIDTAEAYLRGKSETNIGKALSDYDRKKVFITTKLILKPNEKKTEIKSRALKALERLQTDYVDCLMIHGTPEIEQVKNEAFHAAAKELKTEGKIRFVGLSNHGSQYKEEDQHMEKIMALAAQDGRFDVALFVYNFLYREMGENVLKIFKEKNIGATLMKVNPVLEHMELQRIINEEKEKGEEIPSFVMTRLELYKKRVQMTESFNKKYGLKTYPQMRDAAVKFVLNHPDVHTVTLSIKNFDQLEKYVSLSGTRLTAKDKQSLAMYESDWGRFYCRHACGKCEAYCPNGVPVNTIMRYNFYFSAQGREKAAMEQYAALDAPKADACSQCNGICEAHCPYQVPAHALLQRAHKNLSMA